MTLDPHTHQALLGALTISLVAAAAISPFVREAPAPGERRRLAILWGLCAIALGARLALTRLSFVHSNFHGTSLLDEILAFPRPATFRAQYGQYSFWALGGIAALFGRRFEVVATANEVFAALSLGMAAILARRLSGTWTAAWAVLACGAVYVPIARIAGSEDAHNLAVFLGLAGMWALDTYAVERPHGARSARGARITLVAGVAALVLMLDTRQTLYVFAPSAFLMAWWRDRRGLQRDPVFLAAAAVVAAALGARVLATTADASDNVSLIVIGMILSVPAAVVALLAHHPLLDVARFGPALPLLLIAGLATCVRRRRELGGLGIVFAGVFLLVLPFGFPTPGVEYSFRSPVLALGLVVAGVGAAAAADAAGRLAGARVRAMGAWTVACVAVLSLAALGLPARHDLERVAPELVEARFVESVASLLPEDLTWLSIPSAPGRPSYRPPLGVLRRAGHRVTERSGPEAPSYFLFGVECRAWSFNELAGMSDARPVDTTREEIARYAAVVFDRAPVSTAFELRGVRPECAAIVSHAVPVGPRGVIASPTPDFPFVAYSPEDVTLQIYRVDPAGKPPTD